MAFFLSTLWTNTESKDKKIYELFIWVTYNITHMNSMHVSMPILIYSLKFFFTWDSCQSFYYICSHKIFVHFFLAKDFPLFYLFLNLAYA